MKSQVSLLLLALSLSSFSFAQNGPDLMVTAGSQFMSYNLSGSNGFDGSRGSEGSSGRCSSYTDSEGNTVSDNVAGSDGSRGGNGSNGGDGGDLSVIFSNLADLKNIWVNATGGYPGRGGPGGYGGSGCPSGSDGPRGSDGAYGRTGRLLLIPSTLLPYQKDSSNTSMTLGSLIHGQKLVKQLWSSCAGATSLLAPGSQISDTYYTLQGYEYGSARVEVADPVLVDTKLFNDYLNVKLDKNIATVSLTGTHIGLVRHSDASPDAVMIIERMYRQRDFNSTAYETVEGTKGNRKIYLKTSSNLVPWPKLLLHLKVEVKGRWFKYYPVFEGDIDQKFIETTEQGYLIDLDQLPLSQQIQSGAKIRLSFEHQLKEKTLFSEKDTEVWVLRVD